MDIDNTEKIKKIIKSLTPEEIRKLSIGEKKGKYTSYFFLVNLTEENMLHVSCILDDNDNFIVPILPIIFNKNDNVNYNDFNAELLNNELAMVFYTNKYYLLNLQKDNFNNNVIKKERALLTVDAYKKISDSILIGYYLERFLVYDFKNGRLLYTFDSYDKKGDEYHFSYNYNDGYAVLKFDKNMNLVDNKVLFVFGNKHIDVYIPKNFIINKQSIYEEVKKAFDFLYKDDQNVIRSDILQ